MGKIAILSCGASLLDSWPPHNIGEYYPIIAVNWASSYFDCDWMAAGDELCWRMGAVIAPSEGYATFGSPSGPLLREIGEIGLSVDDYGPLRPEIGGVPCPTTLPNALAWAVSRWPGSDIALFGVDMDSEAGISPFDGVEASRSRADSRWDRECLYIRKALEGFRGKVETIGCQSDRSRYLDAEYYL